MPVRWRRDRRAMDTGVTSLADLLHVTRGGGSPLRAGVRVQPMDPAYAPAKPPTPAPRRKTSPPASLSAL
eukprot:10723055-Lingulodinium_polyedra.AAC.1